MLCVVLVVFLCARESEHEQVSLEFKIGDVYKRQVLIQAGWAL